MENAKNTFYVTLQSRLAALNPARTIVVRGVVRPGVLVKENELPTASVPVDAFVLEWPGLTVDPAGPMPMAKIECEIHYATDGNSDNGGMDRGRLLSAMDGELLSALTARPRTVVKMDFSEAGAGVAPVAMATNVFWGDAVFGEVKADRERLERTVTVPVFAYQEAGEL